MSNSRTQRVVLTMTFTALVILLAVDCIIATDEEGEEDSDTNTASTEDTMVETSETSLSATEEVTTPKKEIASTMEDTTTLKEEIALTKEETTMSTLEEITTPKEETTMPMEGATTLKEETISVEETTTLSTLKEETATLLEEITAPKEETTLPMEETTTLSTLKEETATLLEEITAPKEETTLPMEGATTLKEETTMPVEETMILMEKITTPKEETTALKEETTTSMQNSQNTSKVETAGRYEGRWVAARGGAVPDGAVLAGLPAVFVARVVLNSSLVVPGKIRPVEKLFYYAFREHESESAEYEVLTNVLHKWVPSTSSTSLPSNAIPGGFVDKRAVLFIGRTAVNKMLVPGWVSSKTRRFCFSFSGQSVCQNNNYDVLVTYDPSQDIVLSIPK